MVAGPPNPLHSKDQRVFPIPYHPMVPPISSREVIVACSVTDRTVRSKRLILSYAESLLRKDLFVAMCRCQDSLVFEVGKEQPMISGCSMPLD